MKMNMNMKIKMRTKRWLAVVLSGVLVFSLAACSQDVSHQGGSQTSGSGEQAVHLNLPESWGFESFYPVITPANSSSGYGITYYLTSFYDTLVTYDEKGELAGLLAEEWSVSTDGKVYTFKLREGVKFSDGTPLTAEDAARSLLAVPVNLGQYNGGYGKLSTIIADAVAKDDHTVELHLTQPYYSTLRDLCLANPFAIVSSEQLNGDLTAKTSFSTVSYGTGPYMYGGDGDGKKYTFVRNPHYWGERPDVDSFTIKVIADNDAKVLALKNGELDFMSGIAKVSSESYQEMKNTKGFGAAVDKAPTQTYYLGYNLKNPLFAEQVVREAMAAAIDKGNIVEGIFGGIHEQADTFFAQSLPYCDVEQTTYEFDLAKANRLLDDAGYVDRDGDGIREINGTRLAAEFVYQTESVANNDMVVYLCDQFKKIGVELTPKSAPMMEWYAMITGGQYGVTVFKTQGGYYDPANIVSAMNPSQSMDPIIMQAGGFLPDGVNLINEVNSTTDEARIEEIYATILNTIADNCLMTPLYYTHQVVLYNDQVAGYDFPGDASFTSIQNIKAAR